MKDQNNKCSICDSIENLNEGNKIDGFICDTCSSIGYFMDPIGTIHSPDSDPTEAYK